jgi:hypothetical protein
MANPVVYNPSFVQATGFGTGANPLPQVQSTQQNLPPNQNPTYLGGLLTNPNFKNTIQNTRGDSSKMMQHMLDDQDYNLHVDDQTYMRQAAPAVVQQKQYSFYLWLPMIMPVLGTALTATGLSTHNVSDPAQRAEIIQFNSEASSQYTDPKFISSISNNFRLVNTLKPSTKAGVHDLGLWTRRPLFEADKHQMSVAQMKITLIAHMIPAADVNTWTSKSQCWPWLQRLASGVLIEPKPEVMANPCQFFSQYQLNKYLRSFRNEHTADLSFWEMFATPSDMCMLYSELFKGSITDAAFSNAIANRAFSSGRSAVASATRLGHSEARSRTKSKTSYRAPRSSLLTQDELDEADSSLLKGSARKYGGVSSAGSVAKSSAQRKLKGKRWQ